MLKFTIQVTGESEDDISSALDEVKRLIEDGFTSGFDNNETGSYSFEQSREEGS